LLPLVYHELRRMARRHVRQEREGHTLQPSDLIHEAFLRLLYHDVPWQNRAHFLAVASRAMRHVLIDYAKRRNRVKRCGNGVRISLSEAVRLKKDGEPDLSALNDALEELAFIDPRQARIVELRYFGGLTIEQTADVLEVCPATVKREWGLARAWLYTQLATK
jgi:RNA polymerase sigma factor (TIGR02999 family)